MTQAIETRNEGQVLDFNGNKIHYELRDGVVYVDATETAKPYGKRPTDFLRMPSTKEYMDALKIDARKSLIIENQDLTITYRGNGTSGERQGTWLHHKLALRFAGWLDVKLQIWMDSQVEKLLRGEVVAIKPAPKVKKLTMPKIASEMRGAMSILKMCGIEGNQAVISAGQTIERLHGVNPVKAVGVTHLVSEKQEENLTPTEIGKRLPGEMSGQKVNSLLSDMGLQARSPEGNWSPTDMGKEFAVYLDTGKAHTNGAPVKQMKWGESVVDVVTNYLEATA